MTLCVAWKHNNIVHLASDSRLRVGKHSYADVAIKVVSLPYRIYSPGGQSDMPKLAFQGEIGMCFAGSFISSIFVKESVADILKSLQYAPGYTDVSMESLAQFIFTAYRVISTKVCASELGSKGRADLVISGYCHEKRLIRTFLLNTNNENQHSCNEILVAQNDDHVFIGNGIKRAESALPTNPKDINFLEALKTVINDSEEEFVGGAIQYGRFNEGNFQIYSIVDYDDGVHHWRGALDINSPLIMGRNDALIPWYKCIELS